MAKVEPKVDREDWIRAGPPKRWSRHWYGSVDVRGRGLPGLGAGCEAAED